MGILKRAADIAYTFRFIRLMVMDWKDWDAYKLGLIDENGKRNKNVKMDTDAKGGAGLSIAHATGRPIVLVGVGQNYTDLIQFEPEWLLEQLFE